MISLLLAIVPLALANDGTVPPFATTSLGTLRGYTITAENGQQVNVYKAVPFAAPPVGDLRWKLPEAAKSWTGVRDATKYSPACMTNSTQTSSPQKVVSEDCLYLNIFAGARCTEQHKCPVLVYLHGGEINYDSAVMFNETFISNSFPSHDIVMIIPAFRLGFTGAIYFDDAEVVPRNLAIYDILHALRFIQQEIGAFGGAKEQVTLFGHSFGAAITLMLTFSPGTNPKGEEKLFHQAIAMSPLLFYNDPSFMRNLTQELIERSNCTRETVSETVKCMKAIDGHELLDTQRTMEIENPTHKSFGGVVMEPPLFPFSSIADTFRDPNPTRLLLGTTTGEFDNDPRNYDVDKDMPVGLLLGLKNNKELNEIYNRRKEAGTIVNKHASQTQGFYVTVYSHGQAMAATGETVFLYSYDQPTHNTHTDDLSYIMGVHLFEQDKNEQQLAKLYPVFFRNFTLSGIPAPDWTPLNASDAYYSIEVDVDRNRWPETRVWYEKATIDYWVREAPELDEQITHAKEEHDQEKLYNITHSYRAMSMFYPDNRATRFFMAIMGIVMLVATFVLGIACGRLCLNSRQPRDIVYLGREASEKSPLLYERVF